MREINAESLVESAGSGWQGVYGSLSRDGFRVSIAQNPTLSLEGDAKATRQITGATDLRMCRGRTSADCCGTCRSRVIFGWESMRFYDLSQLVESSVDPVLRKIDGIRGRGLWHEITSLLD